MDLLDEHPDLGQSITSTPNTSSLADILLSIGSAGNIAEKSIRPDLASNITIVQANDSSVHVAGATPPAMDTA